MEKTGFSRLPTLSSVMRVLAFGSLVAGLAICVYLEAVRATGAFLPCRGVVCGQLERDPLNANPHVKLSTVGLLGYAALLVLTLATTFGPPAWAVRWIRPARLLAGLGFVASMALVAYVVVRYHGLCPWCEASALCMGLAALALVTLDAAEGERGALPIVAGAGLGLVAFSSLLVSQRTYVGNPEAASSYTVEEIAPVRCRVLGGEPRSVAFVDFGCGSCRRLLEGLLRRRESFAVRIVPPQDAYATAAARLFYRARGTTERQRIVQALLEDTSMTTAGVDRTEARLRNDLLDALGGQEADDSRVTSSLGIRGTPVWMVLDGGKVRLATVAETASASGW